MWYVLEIYKRDENFETIEKMLVLDNLVESFSFEQPMSDEAFNNAIGAIDRNGYLFKLYKNGNARFIANEYEFFVSGEFSMENLYEALMNQPVVIPEVEDEIEESMEPVEEEPQEQENEGSQE